MQRLEVSGAVRHLYGSLGVKELTAWVENAAVLILMAHEGNNKERKKEWLVAFWQWHLEDKE